MVRQETIKKIIDYAKKIPELDPEMVRDGISIFHLHREIDILAEDYTSKRFGISARQFDTLEALFHKQDKLLTPAQLAEEVHLTRSAMTGTLDSLERKRYISRKAHPTDRRRIIISLTRKGADFCEDIMPERYKAMCRVMKSLSEEARENIQEVYGQVLSTLRNLRMEVEN